MFFLSGVVNLHRVLRHCSPQAGLAFLTVTLVLSLPGCGGGGETAQGISSASETSTAGFMPQEQASAPTQTHAAQDSPLPSYTMRAIRHPGGPSPDASVPHGYRVVNSKGQFIANSVGSRPLFYTGSGDEFNLILGQRESVPGVAEALNENGLVVGTGSRLVLDNGVPIDEEEMLFSWRTATGLRVVWVTREGFPSRNVSISDAGQIAFTSSAPDSPASVVQFDTATSTPKIYSGHSAIWMNNGGTVLATDEVGDRGSVTISPDGFFEDVLDIGTPRFLDDQGLVFFDSEEGALVLQGEKVVILGRGCAPLPDVCPGTECAELTRFISFHATGQAVGTDGIQYRDAVGNIQYVPTGGFHWSAASGTSRVSGVPVAVNRHGTVVGNTPDGRAFVWTKASGNVALADLVSDSVLQRGEYLTAVSIGDGGHIVANWCCGKDHPIVLLTPRSNSGP